MLPWCAVESGAIGHGCRVTLVAVALIGLAACSAPVVPVDIPSSICRSGRPAIGISPAVAQVFQRILASAAPDLRGAEVRLTVVSAGTEAGRPAWTCGTGHRADIVLLRETIEDPRVDAPALAHIIGHEIAHVVLHHPRRAAPASFETAEAEADELSVEYLVRAGYDCNPLQKFLSREPLRRNLVHTACERLRPVSRGDPF